MSTRWTFPTKSFDVVHAHQVLQHLSDPIAALREMRRVCAPGGLVAVRDADYAAMTWYPPSAALTRWLELYRLVTTSNGGEPDAGRRLLSWASAAGFGDVAASASAWCFATSTDLAWWSETWAERLRQSDLGRQAEARGLSDARGIGPNSSGLARLGTAAQRLVCRSARRDTVPPLDRLAGQLSIRSREQLQVS